MTAMHAVEIVYKNCLWPKWCSANRFNYGVVRFPWWLYLWLFKSDAYYFEVFNIHPCMWPGCEKDRRHSGVPGFCQEHWGLIPLNVRENLWWNYRNRDIIGGTEIYDWVVSELRKSV